MPLLGDAQHEATITYMQDAEFRRQCAERDEEIAADAPDPELEELFRFFDAPEPCLPSPPEEESATARLERRMRRLAEAGVEHDPRDWL